MSVPRAVQVLLAALSLAVAPGCNRHNPGNGGEQSEASDAVAINRQGNSWFAIREFDKAIADYTEAIRLDPKYAVAYQNRGVVWSEKGEHDKAIADHTEAIRLDPNYAIAFNSRGVAWQRKGEYDKALDDHNRAIQLDPNDAVAFTDRGYTWARKGEHTLAIEDYTQAIRLNPEFSVAHNLRGDSWHALDEYHEAIANYTEAIRLDPHVGAPFTGRAWIRATCPDPEIRDGTQAVSDAKRACDLDGWNDRFRLAVLAAAYAEAGQFDEAVRWEKKALEAPGHDPLAAGQVPDRLKLYQARKPLRFRAKKK